MKVRLEVDGKVFEYKREPMSLERFTAVCRLVGLAIGGVVLLGATHMVGGLALILAAVVFYLYRLLLSLTS